MFKYLFQTFSGDQYSVNANTLQEAENLILKSSSWINASDLKLIKVVNASDEDVLHLSETLKDNPTLNKHIKAYRSTDHGQAFYEFKLFDND